MHFAEILTCDVYHLDGSRSDALIHSMLELGSLVVMSSSSSSDGTTPSLVNLNCFDINLYHYIIKS